ncbi:hypothetical protein D3C84_963540 [compost metagenome]
MIDDGVVQMAMLAVGVAHVDGRQDHFVLPGAGGLDQQYRRRTTAQQFPVIRGQQGLFQRAVGKVLLDHQPTSLGLLHIDDGVMQSVAPRLLGGDAVADFQ